MYQWYNVSYRSVSIIIAGLQTNIWGLNSTDGGTRIRFGSAGAGVQVY